MTPRRTWAPWGAALVGLALLSGYAWAFSREEPDLDQRSTWLQRSLSASERRGDEIRTTTVPFSLPRYLTDAELPRGEEVDLAALVSGEARTSAGVLQDAALRIGVGGLDGLERVEFSWTVAPDSKFVFKLYDAQSRPLGRWSGSAGRTGPLELRGGVYRLVLTAEGALGTDFRLLARSNGAGASQTDLRDQTAAPADAPTIRIQMSPANFALWESMRREAYQALTSIGIPAEFPNRKVTARFTVDGAVTQVKVWLAGQGQREHVSASAPSFTVQVRAGPLIRGLSRFKLYGIRTQNGLLDYVVASLVEDEGVFVPRKLFSNVVLNGRNMGLYVVEELAKTRGHFEAHQRYDGQITADGKLYSDLNGVWRKKPPLTSGEEFSRAFTSRVEQGKFAKAVALASRFHMTHGIERGEIRFYRSVLLERPEPWIRDINIDPWDALFGGYGSLLMHTGWWLQPQLIAVGPHSNPKPSPPLPGLPTGHDIYEVGPATLRVSSVHPLIRQFVALPEHRPTFDRYLFYVSDPSFQSRFVRRLRQTYAVVRPLLGNALTESWIEDQVSRYSQNELIAGRAVRAFKRTSRLLVKVEPEASPASTATPEHNVLLYNLSPFSAQLRLPDYVPGAVSDSGTDGSTVLDFAPSQLFLSVVPHYGANASHEFEGNLDNWDLSPAVAQRLLTLEGLRYRSREGENSLYSPLRRIVVPADRIGAFLEWLETHSEASLGGIYPLTTARHMVIPDAAQQNREAPPLNLGKTPDTWGLAQAGLEDPDLLVYLMETAKVERGTRFTYLISNLSDRPIELDFSELAIVEVGRGRERSELESVWWLGDEVREAGESRLTLGPASQESGPDGPRRPSPWLWPGGVSAFLRGAVDPARPNAVLAEILVRDCGLVFTDAGALGVRQEEQETVQALALEPTRVSCMPSIVRPLVGRDTKPLAVLTSIDSATRTRSLGLGRAEITTYSTFVGLEAGAATPWQADALFDDNAWTYWRPDPSVGPGPYWFAVDFGEATGLTEIRILRFPGAATDETPAVAKMVVQGSDDGLDGGTWTDLERSHEDAVRPDDFDRHWIRIRLSGDRAYRYYRLLSPDPADLSVREVRFEIGDRQSLYNETVPVEAFVQAGLLAPAPSAVDGLRLLRPTRPELTVTGIVEIPGDSALELPPGTVVRFGPEAGILSYGPIRALGTAEAPVRFLPAFPAVGFRGIAIVDARAPSLFEHVELAGARGGFFGSHQISGGLSVFNSSVRIARSHLHDLPANDGVHLSHADFMIEDSTVEGTASDALDIDWGFGTVVGSSFARCGLVSGDCLDISGARVDLRDIRIEGASDKGVSIGELSVVEISGLQVSNSRIAVAVKDGAVVRIEDCALTRNDYGLLRYIKKPIYPYPALVENGCRYAGNAVARRDEPDFIWTRRYD